MTNTTTQPRVSEQADERTLVIGVSAQQDGATIVIMQPHKDGSTTVIYSCGHPIGDSSGRASLTQQAAPEAPASEQQANEIPIRESCDDLAMILPDGSTAPCHECEAFYQADMGITPASEATTASAFLSVEEAYAQSSHRHHMDLGNFKALCAARGWKWARTATTASASGVEIELAKLAAAHYGRPGSDVPALIAFERHRAKQSKVTGMPGLSGAISNFITGFNAGRASSPSREAAPQAELAAVPSHIREFVTAVADNYVHRGEDEQLQCNGCYVNLGDKEPHKPDCIVRRARAMLAAPVDRATLRTTSTDSKKGGAA